MRFKFRNITYDLTRRIDSFCLSEPKINEKTGREYLSNQYYFRDLSQVVNELFNRHVLDASEKHSLLQCINDTRNELKTLFGA